MEFTVEIPEYDKTRGFQLEWEQDFKIDVSLSEDGGVLIVANNAALISMARHFLALTQPEFKSGAHFHLDVYTALEEGSNELIIQKA